MDFKPNTIEFFWDTRFSDLDGSYKTRPIAFDTLPKLNEKDGITVIDFDFKNQIESFNYFNKCLDFISTKNIDPYSSHVSIQLSTNNSDPKVYSTGQMIQVAKDEYRILFSVESHIPNLTNYIEIE